MLELIGVVFIWLFLLIIGVLIAVWVYRDAQKRYPRDSSMPILWVLIVLLTGIIGLIVYILVRPPERGEEQPYSAPPAPQY